MITKRQAAKIGNVLVVLYLVAIVCLFATADPPDPTPRLAPYIETPVTAARIVDGDTISTTVSVTLPVRLAGIDTPELRDRRQRAAGQVAAEYTRRWMESAQSDSRFARLRLFGLGLYGRMEGDFYNEAGESLSSYLVEAGVAVPSDGKRREWTDAELKAIEGLPQ